MYRIKASSEIKMAISIGQMNSYLKNYTDALLTLHGIPTTDYTHEVSSENMMAEFTARKTLETAIWQFAQHAEAQAEKLAQLKRKRSTIAMAEYVALEGHGAICIDKMKTLDPECLLEQSCDYLEELGWTLTPPATTQKLVEAVKKLHHHIITPSKTAEQSAERYDAIVEFAEETLAPYGGAKKREWFDPSDDEEETDEEEEDRLAEEEMEIARLNAEVGWKCVKCGPKSEDEDFAFHEVKYHPSHGTLCLKCYRRHAGKKTSMNADWRAAMKATQ